MQAFQWQSYRYQKSSTVEFLRPVHIASFSYETEQNLSVLTLRSHCSAVKTELFVNANEKRINLKMVHFENDLFSV